MAGMLKFPAIFFFLGTVLDFLTLMWYHIGVSFKGEIGELHMIDNIKRQFTIRNSADGGAWYINALENDLRAYCKAKGLDIEVFKSGWIIKHMSFVISGKKPTSVVYGIIDDLKAIYAGYMSE
jgi:hypothetical protein